MQTKGDKISPPKDLRCEYERTPLGLDVEKPRFSWNIDPGVKTSEQTAYRILISSSRQKLSGGVADVWDSDKTESSSSINVTYEGPELESKEDYYWKVKWWNADGEESEYSEIAKFEMGLLSPEEWDGEWVGWPMGDSGRELLFRKEFELDRSVEKARIYFSAVGLCEVTANGKKATESVMNPGWTDTSSRVLYSTADVTELLVEGKNVIGIRLANGWEPGRKLIAQVYAELRDGSTRLIPTDWSWNVSKGPIINNSIYDGEVYDAREEKPGWNCPKGSDNGSLDLLEWDKAQLVAPPAGKLISQNQEPIKVVRSVKPETISNPEPDVYVYDLGENIAGWARLKVRGREGNEVKLKYAENLHEDGTVDQRNLRNARCVDEYIQKGGGSEEYEPRFTYHGFRYVQVEGLEKEPEIADLKGKVVRSAVKKIGDFSCSNDLINKIQENVVRGTAGNLHSVPTDSPQRNERLSWLGDVTSYGEESILNFDMAKFYEKWLKDINDAQNDSTGSVPDTAPFRWGSDPGDPGWGSCYVLLAWNLYNYYGDRRVLKEHYDDLKRWVEFLRDKAEENILAYYSYGDWSPPVEYGKPLQREAGSDGEGGEQEENGAFPAETPGELTSTCFYYASTKTLAKIAGELGKTDDAGKYKKLSESIEKSFNEKFFRPEAASYSRGSQTCNAMPLYFGMVPDGEEGAVIESLVESVKENDGHLTTGIFGTKYLLLALSKYERTDIAYEIATKKSYPGWGYMISKGATTIWERWEYETGAGMNSHNHPMLGSISEWFHKYLAGIRVSLSEPGFRKVIIQPSVVDDLDYVKDSIETQRGTVESGLRKKDDGTIEFQIAIPGNSRGEFRLPEELDASTVEVYENDRLIWDKDGRTEESEGILDAFIDGDNAVFVLRSGKHVLNVVQ